MDHIDGAPVHLAQRDVTLEAASLARFPKDPRIQETYRLGFNWVSSHENDFNLDYHVSFTKDEMAKGNVYYNFEWSNYRARNPLDKASLYHA